MAWLVECLPKVHMRQQHGYLRDRSNSEQGCHLPFGDHLLSPATSSFERFPPNYKNWECFHSYFCRMVFFNACMYVSAPHACSAGGRGCRILWNWTYGWLLLTTQALGLKPKSSGKEASALNVYPASKLLAGPLFKTKNIERVS